MGQRQATVELTLLEYIVLSGSDRRWRFKAKPNPHFDQLIRDFMTVHLFQMREVYFTLTSGDYSKQHAYEISEEGMWFLSHLFTNWTEMFEKAKVHTSRTYQGLPQCSVCSHECMTECAHCRQPFCERCYTLHEFERQRQQRQQQEQPFQAFNFHSESTQGTAPGTGYFDLNDFIHAFQGARYTGTFTQTPTIPIEVRNAHTLLGITKEKPTEDEIRQAFVRKAKATHPDTGGRGGDMDKLTKAKECALKFVGVK